MTSHIFATANVLSTSPTIIVNSGDGERLSTTTIYPFSQGEYCRVISVAMPCGNVDPMDLFMVVAPMCFKAYWMRLATSPPRTLMSRSGAHPTVTSAQPNLTKASRDGRVPRGNMVLFPPTGAIQTFNAQKLATWSSVGKSSKKAV